MRYHITHAITYRYDRPVILAPQAIRLRPRCDVAQKLHHFSLSVTPTPDHLIETIDLDGNPVYQAWFAGDSLTKLTIEASSEVETFRDNPFAYLLEPWAVHLPIDYPLSLSDRLFPYLRGQQSRLTGGCDPIAVQLAQEIWYKTAGDVVNFLTELTQRIYRECGYQLRETGTAMPPGITWSKKTGSCRDYAMLFIEVCRAIGLAARFVSGYQEGDLTQTDRQLHAWAEVYLPGAGWRGYDPTHGLAVANTHIALVACPTHQNTAPVSGSLKQGTGARSDMNYKLQIEKR
ncbi:MAG: transglutaminase family protein [Elainellaceae cyanobacterium]